MNGLGQIARGVLASAAALAVLLGAVFWISNGPATPSTASPPLSDGESDASIRIDRTIRVRLTRRPVRQVRLRVDGPCRVVSSADRSEPLLFNEPLPERTITAGSGGVQIGDRFLAGEDVEIVPAVSPAIWIDGRKYRGSVRLHRTADDRLVPVNVLPLEEYVAAVVDAEMPASFPIAAREAQAIVARTYAISCQRDSTSRPFDLYSTPVSQNYLGVVYRHADGRFLAGETPAGRAATAATTGVVCTHDGTLFRTYYSACCGGRTFAGGAVFGDETPTLCSVECGGCNAAPLFRWERVADDLASFNRLIRKTRTRVPDFGSIRTVETLNRPDRTVQVALSDGRHTARLEAAEVRSALGLPSLCFDLSGDGDKLVARGRGHGHGVGLCQWGAKGLAERGFSTEAIVKHYYPGCELTREHEPSDSLAGPTAMPYIQQVTSVPR